MVRYQQTSKQLYTGMGFQNTQGERWVWQGGCTQEHAEEAVAWMTWMPLFFVWYVQHATAKCAWYSGTFSTGLQLCPKSTESVVFHVSRAEFQIVTLKGHRNLLLFLARAHALLACQITQLEVHFLTKVWLTEQEPWKGAGPLAAMSQKCKITSSWKERMEKMMIKAINGWLWRSTATVDGYTYSCRSLLNWCERVNVKNKEINI